MQNEKYINGLYARVDWLEFTVDIGTHTIDDVYRYICELGLPVDLFDELDRGGFGYKRTIRHLYENIFVYYHGNIDMGIHFRISGSSVSYVLDEFLETFKCETPWGPGYDVGEYDAAYILPLLLNKILSFGHFTRIDLAVDDLGTRYYSVRDVVSLVRNYQIVTKFRNWQNIEGNTFASSCSGHTLYFGSRMSDVYLRIYEKGLEQDVPVDWVRWELEIKHEKADLVARQLATRENIGVVTLGILNAYIRFINLDNSNRYRCTLHPVWASFIAEVSKLRLTLLKTQKTVAQKEEWINKQCMPTLAGLILSKQGDISFIRDKLEESFERLSAKDKLLFMREVDSNEVR